MKDTNEKLKDTNEKLEQKEKDYENSLKMTIFNFTVCDKVLIERLWDKGIDINQIMSIFESKSENLRLLKTFTEETRKEYMASISLKIDDDSGVKPPTNK